MKLVVINLIVFLATSCVALEPPKRWTNDNIFYSQKEPEIKIIVDDKLRYEKKQIMAGQTESVNAEETMPNTSSEYFFRNNNLDKELRIYIHSTTYNHEWYYQHPNYSSALHLLDSENKTISGLKYATGIFNTPDNWLVKVYGRLVSMGTYIKISYAEKYSGGLSVSDQLSTRQLEVIINEFSDKADRTFQIISYEKHMSVVQEKKIAPIQVSPNQSKNSWADLSKIAPIPRPLEIKLRNKR